MASSSLPLRLVIITLCVPPRRLRELLKQLHLLACVCGRGGHFSPRALHPPTARPPPPSRLVAVVRGPPPRRKPKWGSISIRSDSGASGAAWRRCHSRVAVLKSAAAAGTMSLVMMAMVGKMWLPRLPGGLCVWRPGPPPREATAV